MPCSEFRAQGSGNLERELEDRVLHAAHHVLHRVILHAQGACDVKKRAQIVDESAHFVKTRTRIVITRAYEVRKRA